MKDIIYNNNNNNNFDHFKRVQESMPGDNGRRLMYAKTMLDRKCREENYLDSITWTDESPFYEFSTFNIHNDHYYATENPNLLVPPQAQRPWSVNFWTGLTRDKIVSFNLTIRLLKESRLILLKNGFSQILL